MKLFDVMANLLIAIGALVGGVAGILLPKVSMGLTLGTLLSLLISMVKVLATREIISSCCIR